MLDAEFRFFIQNQEELVAKHRGQVVVIRGEEVVGVHRTALEAYLESQKRFAPGTFLLQACEPGPEAYTVTISSHELFCPAV
jgi:hypothetical protein